MAVNQNMVTGDTKITPALSKGRPPGRPYAQVAVRGAHVELSMKFILRPPSLLLLIPALCSFGRWLNTTALRMKVESNPSFISLWPLATDRIYRRQAELKKIYLVPSMIFALYTQPAIYICENNNWTGRKSNFQASHVFLHRSSHPKRNHYPLI